MPDVSLLNIIIMLLVIFAQIICFLILLRKINRFMRPFDFAVYMLQNPKRLPVWLWNKIICKFFRYERLVQYPTNSMHAMIHEPTILSLVKGVKVLDCGCGTGRWGYLLGKKHNVIGIDIDHTYLMYAKKKGRYTDLIQANISAIPFKNKTFDTAIAVEVIEHVTKEDGYKLIAQLKETTVHRIILTTPENFLPLEGHISGWQQSALRNEGFKCVRIRPKGWNHNWLLAIYDSS